MSISGAVVTCCGLIKDLSILKPESFRSNPNFFKMSSLFFKLDSCIVTKENQVPSVLANEIDPQILVFFHKDETQSQDRPTGL